jgi:hypothetical protein
MIKINDNLLDVFNAMFKDRESWKYVNDELKEKYFFIVNRNLSKKYPEKAQLFNTKNIDKVSSMNLWYSFMYNKPYPKWFWNKMLKENNPKISDKDYQFLLYNLKVKKTDLDYLINNNINFVLKELKYYKQLEKGN